MSDKYIIKGDTLTDIADALRLKRDIVTEITPEDMPLQVALIDGGGSGVDYSELNAFLSVDSGDWIEVTKVQPNWNNALYNEINTTFERNLTNWNGVALVSDNQYNRHMLRFKDFIRAITFQAGQGSYPASCQLYLELGDTLRAGGGYEHNGSSNLAKAISVPKNYTPEMGNREFTVSSDIQFNSAETVLNTYTHISLNVAGVSGHDRCCPLGNFTLATPIVSNPSAKHNISLKFTW